MPYKQSLRLTLYHVPALGYLEPMNDIDLNLLTALDVLLDEGSVTGAAKRLNLSASAMSRTLKRLRQVTGDPLLVRAGRGLVPTPHAFALRERVHAVAREAEELLHPTREALDLSYLERTFVLRANAAFIERFSVPLVTTIAEVAPRVRLRFAPKPTKAVEPLREGLLDLEVGVIETTAPELVMRGLFQDRLIGVARTGHPLFAGDITSERIAACQHVMASSSGKFTGPMGDALSALGLDAEFSVVVPGFSDALRIVACTDCVTVVPQSSLAPSPMNDVCTQSGLQGFDLPAPTLALMISALWHPRLAADPAHRWFRELVISTCRAVYPHE